MSDVETKTDAQEASVGKDEAVTAPQDLRAELKINLESEFKANLVAAGVLPNAVQKSLVELLDADGLSSTDILEALALEDPISPEVPSE